MLVIFLAALVTCLTFLYHIYGNRSGDTGESHTYRINDPELCRLIIAGKHSSLDKREKNELLPLSSKAGPNERLKIAFGIDNSFTSKEESYVKSFIKKATNSINLEPNEWVTLSRHAHDVVKNCLTDNGRIKLTSMVQTLSMRLALWILFERAENNSKSHVEDDDIVNLAEAINRVWLESKSSEIPKFEKNDGLKKALSAVFPGHNILEPKENPLNLVLPAFETLWRATLATFIEVRFTTGRHNPEWRRTLVEFSQMPTMEKFKMGVEGGISAEFLVSEALRLYPPTRRIHRRFRWRGETEIDIAADIEASHTAMDIWGQDVTVFNPGRWGYLSEEQRNAYLPFGSRPYLCPASLVFGPWMIGLLVGALIGEMWEDGWLYSTNAEIMEELTSGVRLRTERNSYEEVYLVSERPG